MALRMVALGRAQDGRWFARKGIPEDVRDPITLRLYGLKREAHLKLPADTPHHEAKTRLAEWSGLKPASPPCAQRMNGEGQPLTRLNAIALAGRWYTWFVGQHEDDPGPAKRWQEMSDHLVWNVIHPEAPESYLQNPDLTRPSAMPFVAPFCNLGGANMSGPSVSC